MDREAWRAAVHGVQRVGHDSNWTELPGKPLQKGSPSHIDQRHPIVSELHLFISMLWDLVSFATISSVSSVQFSSFQLLSRVRLFATHPLLSPSPPAPKTSSIRVFSNESTLHKRWPKYWSFSFSISPSNEHPGLISFRMDWVDLLAVQGTLKSILQHHSSKASILRRSAFW